MSSSVCIDANLIVRSLVPSDVTSRVLALLSQWHADGAILIAPALLAFEVTSSLRRLVYLGQITPAEGEVAFTRFLLLDIHLSLGRSLLALAWQFAKRFRLSRAYDSTYLALAYMRGCEFWTADEKLYNAVSHELKWVKWIGNSAPA